MMEEAIAKHLSKNFADEISILGTNQVDKIIQAKLADTELKIFSSEKGRNIEFLSLITVVGVAVQIIDFSLRIVKENKEKPEPQKISPVEVRKKVQVYLEEQKLKPENNSLDFNPYSSMIEDILNEV